jgi:predicted transcriptional regulator
MEYIYYIMATTIKISEEMRDYLNELKLHPRETYNDILERVFEDMRELNEKTKREIKKAIKEIKDGKYKTHEEVGKELGF